MMRISVVGLGYIGFPLACLLAHVGHQVIGVDINYDLVKCLQNGDLHIVNEPDLDEIARRVLSAGSFRVATEPGPSDAFLICVPTPIKERCQGAPRRTSASGSTLDGKILPPQIDTLLEDTPVADLSFVVSATRMVAPYVRPGDLVVLESTVPPGTTKHVVVPLLQELGVDINSIHVAYVPERVLPGDILREMVNNDRVVGGTTPEATRAVCDLYASFVRGEILATDATTAEFTKLVENAYRDVNIAFANELARLSMRIGVDVGKVIALANHHPRVHILQPGPGVGGHCIAVDPYFIIQQAPELAPLLRAARAVNRSMPQEVVNVIATLVPAGGQIAMLGAAYKGNVGDDRESPSLEAVRLLSERGYSVSVHDPYVKRYVRSLVDVIAGADLIAVLTDHRVYRDIDPSALILLVRHRVVFDVRRILERPVWEKAGFEIHVFGDG